jgi:Fuc2NAc and GlcNAc transferase
MEAKTMMIWFLFTFSFLLLTGFFFTKILINYSHKHQVLDFANQRSSHTIATPRIGGLSFVVLIVLGFLTLSFFKEENERNAIILGVLMPCLLVAFVGLLDDLRGLSQSQRLIVYLCASLLAVMQLNLTHEPFSFYLVAIILLTAAFAWLINLFNFMDGIDGIAASQAIFVLTALTYFNYTNGHEVIALSLASCVAPILGFLLLNWQPAKIFMGDAGSTFLGCLLGCMIIVTINVNAITLYCAIVLLGSFIVDASWTLSYRVLTRQEWYSAHRSHVYQILSRRFKSHRKVALLYTGINLCWLLPLSLVTFKYKDYAPALVIIALMPLVVICFSLGAGKSNQN